MVIIFFICSVYFLNFFFMDLDPDSGLDPNPDPIWPDMLDPDLRWNRCGSETLSKSCIIYFCVAHCWCSE
jgi:hypothetical protein